MGKRRGQPKRTDIGISCDDKSGGDAKSGCGSPSLSFASKPVCQRSIQKKLSFSDQVTPCSAFSHPLAIIIIYYATVELSELGFSSFLERRRREQESQEKKRSGISYGTKTTTGLKRR
jgi:hypothetical protein